MNPQIKKILILAALVVGLVIVIWVNVFRVPSPPDMGTAQENQQPSTQQQVAATPETAAAVPAGQTQFKSSGVDIETLLAEVKEVEFDYAEHRLARNPMTPLIGPAARVTLPPTSEAGADRAALQELQDAISGMTVMAIVWDEEDPYAVINNEVVSRGHRLAEGRIIVEQVQRDRVILRVGESLIPLKMKEL